MTKARDLLIKVIRNRVAVLNMYSQRNDYKTENFERLGHELDGMLICLKNIAEKDCFYCVLYKEDTIEFGYYDDNGNWIVIE